MTTEDLTHLTTEEREALTFIRKAVAEKGEDYTYQPVPLDNRQAAGVPDWTTCTYLNYDPAGKAIGPSCIVGHVLVDFGRSFGELFYAEARDAATAAGLRPDSRLGRALTRAQSAQDRGDTWGVALAEFEQALEVCK